MPIYRVRLNGTNFWLDLDGKPSRMGFFTNRVVEADSAEAAELAAVQLLREEEKLRGVLKSRDDPPVIYADEIVEVAGPPDGQHRQGLALYLEENDS